MTARAEADERLRALAEHLDPKLGARLRELVDADSRAGRVLEIEGVAQRAQDLVAELRRCLDARDRTFDSLRAENHELRRRLGIQPWEGVPISDAPTIGQSVRDAQRVPVLPAPPPPPPAPRIHG